MWFHIYRSAVAYLPYVLPLLTYCKNRILTYHVAHHTYYSILMQSFTNVIILSQVQFNSDYCISFSFVYMVHTEKMSQYIHKLNYANKVNKSKCDRKEQ